MIPRRSASRPAPAPRLSRWQWTWRYLAAAALSALTWGELAAGQWREHQLTFWFELATGVVAFVAYAWYRRWPLPVVVGLLVLSGVSSPAAGPAVLGMVSIATRRRWREIVSISVISVVAGTVYQAVRPDPALPALVMLLINLLATGIFIAIGMYIGARRELLSTLQDRAERAESEQSLRVSQARANERARIAREMHDVLAHRISLVAMHAGALGYRNDLDPAESAEVAGIIQDNAHRALSDLREILGVLRADELDRQPERPQPTLGDLPALLLDERHAGARIRLRDRSKRLKDLPESVSRHAYRILQESLTNARKHAPNTLVDVVVAGAPGASLILLVRNPLPIGRQAGSEQTAPGAGLGLVGLIERAALSGGRLDHRVSRKHFVVRAQLPWPA